MTSDESKRQQKIEGLRAKAETLYIKGRILDTGEACTTLESRYQLEPVTSTLLDLAVCREKNGQLATAWGMYLEVERQTRDAPDQMTKKLHQVVLDRAKQIEPRLSKLTINVSAGNNVEGFEVVRGDETIGPAMWNRALPINGGNYKIIARAPGSPEWTTEITVGAEADTKTIEIPKL